MHLAEARLHKHHRAAPAIRLDKAADADGLRGYYGEAALQLSGMLFNKGGHEPGFRIKGQSGNPEQDDAVVHEFLPVDQFAKVFICSQQRRSGVRTESEHHRIGNSRFKRPGSPDI